MAVEKESSHICIKKSQPSGFLAEFFKDYQNFAITTGGLAFTLISAVAGVVAFIVLSQLNMPMTAGLTFAGSVFGYFAVSAVACKLYKHGFFGPNDNNRGFISNTPSPSLTA